jgi:valyl-tRNA synthetase
MDDYGTDSCGFTLMVGSTPGNDTNQSLRSGSNRNFANKVWNAGASSSAAGEGCRAPRRLSRSGRWPIRGSGRA